MNMTPGAMFCVELVWLGLFGWYFATDFGTRKRILALLLVVIAVGLSIVLNLPPEKKIRLRLDFLPHVEIYSKVSCSSQKKRFHLEFLLKRVALQFERPRQGRQTKERSPRL